MQTASVVVTAYRSPFDGDVDPGMPSWKRDLILRRRAMSRTLGSPVPGILDVASILAMSRSSSGATSSVLGAPAADRARNSIKPSNGGSITTTTTAASSATDGRDAFVAEREEAAGETGEETSNSWVTAGGRPTHERTHARQAKRGSSEDEKEEPGSEISKVEPTDASRNVNGYAFNKSGNSGYRPAAASASVVGVGSSSGSVSAAGARDAPSGAAELVVPHRSLLSASSSSAVRSDNHSTPAGGDDSPPDESSANNLVSFPSPSVRGSSMKADIATTSNSLSSASTAVPATRTWRGCEKRSPGTSSANGFVFDGISGSGVVRGVGVGKPGFVRNGSSSSGLLTTASVVNGDNRVEMQQHTSSTTGTASVGDESTPVGVENGGLAGTPAERIQPPPALPNRRSIKKFFSADLTPSERKRSAGLIAGGSSNGGEFINDSEFEYGPGFVNKLRTKFINLTLKQQKDPLRPALRRVASLEDILDKDDAEPGPSSAAGFVNGNCAAVEAHHHHHQHHHNNNNSHRRGDGQRRPVGSYGVRGGGYGDVPNGRAGGDAGNAKVPASRLNRRELLKARSMETLLAVSVDDEKSEPPSFAARAEKSDKKVIIEPAHGKEGAADTAKDDQADATLSTSAPPSAATASASAGANGSGVAGNVVTERELPPPDTVKSIKKLYEPNSPRGRAALNMNKTGKTSGALPQQQQQQLQQPQQQQQGANKINYKNTLQRNVNVPKATPRPRLEFNSFQQNQGDGQQPTSPPTAKPEVPAKSAVLLRKTTGPKPPATNGGFESKIVSRFTATSTSTSSSSASAKAADRRDDGIEVDGSSDDSEERLKSDSEEEEDVITTVKRVSLEAVQNIRAGGTSIQFNFKASSESFSAGGGHLPGVGGGNNNNKTKQVNGNGAGPKPPPPRQIGVIRPITKFEETNNLINLSKTAEDRKKPPAAAVIPTKDVVDAAAPPPPPSVSKFGAADVEAMVSGAGGLSGNKTTFKREAAKTEPTSSGLTVTFGGGRRPQQPPPSSSSDPGTVVVARPALVAAVDEEEVVVKKPAEVKSSDQVMTAPSAGPTTGGGGGPKPTSTTVKDNKWHQQPNNTLQFNFSKREFVPDYIENDGMDLSKRSAKLADSGVIRIGGVGGESGTDEEDVIVARLSLRPPSPCNVEFVNANVVVAGKSSLRKSASKSSKGKLSFNDAMTVTFEYPSERSLVNESLVEMITQSQTSSFNGGSTSQDSAIPRIEDAGDGDSGGIGAKPFPGTSVAAAGSGSGQLGGLASYTPSKIPMGTTFELGVTRTVAMSSSSSSSNNSPSSSSSGNGNKDGEPAPDYLKEASTGETFTQAGITADLLF